MNQKISHILSIAATVLLIVAMASLYQLDALFSSSPMVITFQIIAVALMAWARTTFGRRSFNFSAVPKTEILITEGAYKFIRHPIYAAIWLFSWAGVAAHLSFINVVLALTVLVALIVRILCEEFCLRQKFPEYSHYAKRTARLIPFVL